MRIRLLIPSVPLLFLMALPLRAQSNPPPLPGQAHPKVDQRAVDEAIRRGREYLLGHMPGLTPIDAKKGGTRYHELVLLTLIHAGVPPTEPAFEAALNFVLTQPLERTYCVSLQAMLLQELDPVKYQWRIAQCAQFLADNQCRNGQWHYGKPVEIPAELNPGNPIFGRADVATGRDGARPIAKATARPVMRIVKQSKGDTDGDNSNSQYAALGIRACVSAGIGFDPKILKQALAWWEKAQLHDGGWSYDTWVRESYGSMSAGALGSVCIYKHLLNEPWKQDPRVLKGCTWLGKNFSVKKNPGTMPDFKSNPKKSDQWWYFYFMYALERAGLLYGTEFFGRNEWYPEGVRELLARQGEDGKWEGLSNTCFAILFLRRATRPLIDVATGASQTPREE